MDYLEGLNPQQREAVTAVEGPLLILAGAGSGKTRVITHRIAHLVDAHHVSPSAIVAVTFTNKAAGEMRERVERLLGGAHPLTGMILATFHSFCVRLLRRDGPPLADLRPGFTRDFTIYDEDDQVALIKGAYRHLGLVEKDFLQYRAALSRISHAKNHKQTPDELAAEARDPVSRRLATVWEHYEGRLRQANALDFDDLLLESVRLLEHDERVRQGWNNRIRHLLIDEYQDTNRSQYELMRLLTQKHQNVCVVGDEDQSIYSWRGADIRNILDFERDFPRARTIRLEQNYRSTRNILESAGAVVAHNKMRKGKRLWTAGPEGARLGLFEAEDGEQEALYIADTVERLMREYPQERVAVLYRTNFQSRQIEEALRRYGRRYQVIGGFSFYQRAEIKDVLAYLKAVASPQDSVSLLRVINTPARGIGKSTVEQVEGYALDHSLSLWSAIVQLLEARQFPTRAEAAMEAFRKLMEELREAAGRQPLPELIGTILDRTGYRQMLENDTAPDAEGRLENLAELANAAAEAAERGESITDFLDHAALVAEADNIQEQVQVSLLTLHNAKGLEFPTVFVAGLEEGLFPHNRSINSGSEETMEEERRLCYVGMTRAQKRLFLTWARSRRRFAGQRAEACIPSRFLDEVPSELTEELGRRRRHRELDLGADRILVRDSARRNAYTGKTYNSLENIAEFFAARGVAKPAVPVKPAPVAAPAAPPRKSRSILGATVEHPRYGRGIVVRREGEGDSAKLTVSFPGHGLKKIVEKFATLKPVE